MGKVIDETGNRYGRLTVIEQAKGKHRRARWLCLCDCSATTVVRGVSLRNGHTQSCGCLRRDVAFASLTIHGLRDTPEYDAWAHMLQRCANVNDAGFFRYGARGIQVCQKWRESFEAFFADMGPRPTSKHSLDRIDNDGDYIPENCRWATRKQQNRNQRSNVWLTHDGQTLCMADWADKLGMNRSTLITRLRRGWSIERALSTPV